MPGWEAVWEPVLQPSEKQGVSTSKQINLPVEKDLARKTRGCVQLTSACRRRFGIDGP